MRTYLATNAGRLETYRSARAMATDGTRRVPMMAGVRIPIIESMKTTAEASTIGRAAFVPCPERRTKPTAHERMNSVRTT